MKRIAIISDPSDNFFRDGSSIFPGSQPHVADVEGALSRIPVAHISFRYGAADARVASFDKTLAEFEWAYYLRFGVILSDPDAYRLMRTRKVCYPSSACL